MEEKIQQIDINDDLIDREIIVPEGNSGFQSSARDYRDKGISFDKLFKLNSPSIFPVRLIEDAMLPEIHPNDILIIDKDYQFKLKSGSLIIVEYNEELICRRMIKHSDKIELAPTNKKYKTIYTSYQSCLHIWGIVTHIIRKSV